MTWTVTIPGQPPSVNHSYKPVMIKKRGTDGNIVRRIGIAKQTAVADYQTAVVGIARVAKPSRWQPSGTWIRLRYRFFLRRSIDCDNALKALNDAIAIAIGVNDERFLPCVMSKSVSTLEPNPRVEIEISSVPDDPFTLPSSPPTSSPPSASTATSRRR